MPPPVSHNNCFGAAGGSTLHLNINVDHVRCSHFSFPRWPLQNRPVTAAFLRSLAEEEKGEGGATNKMSAKAEKGSSQTDVRVGAP